MKFTYHTSSFVVMNIHTNVQFVYSNVCRSAWLLKTWHFFNNCLLYKRQYWNLENSLNIGQVLVNRYLMIRHVQLCPALAQMKVAVNAPRSEQPSKQHLLSRFCVTWRSITKLLLPAHKLYFLTLLYEWNKSASTWMVCGKFVTF